MVLTVYAKNQALSNITSGVNTAITHIGIGTDNTTPVYSNTTLGGEEYREAKFSSVVLNSSINEVLYLDTSEANGFTYTELGTFSASSAGTMYTHNLITSFAKTANKTAYYSIKINFQVI